MVFFFFFHFHVAVFESIFGVLPEELRTLVQEKFPFPLLNLVNSSYFLVVKVFSIYIVL